jgi:hypothetical protein
MSTFLHEFMIAARQTPRQYFAIFVGAYRGIRTELRALEQRDAASHKPS